MVKAKSKSARKPTAAEKREVERQQRREERLMNAEAPLSETESDEATLEEAQLSAKLQRKLDMAEAKLAAIQKQRPAQPPTINESPARKAGSPNGDGTYYGGGPNTFSCSTCLGAGLPADIAWGHRAGMRKHCVVLQQQEAHGPEEESMPVQKIVSQILQDEPKNTESTDLDNHSPDEVLAMLAQGAVTAQQAKLSWVQAMRFSTPAEREILQTYVNNADALQPTRVGNSKQNPYSSIGLGHGKLVRLFMACRAHARAGLHKGKAKAEHKREVKFDVTTMSVVLDIDADEASNTIAIFNLSFAHFRHAVVIKTLLTELECHTLEVWMATQFALSTKLCVVERTLLRFLAELDDDMSQSMVNMVQSRGDNLLQAEQRIYDSEKPSKPPKDFPGEAAKKKALKKPNDVSCWYWSNDFACKHKDENGKCRFEHLHGTCGVPLDGGGHCMENHKATEHR